MCTYANGCNHCVDPHFFSIVQWFFKHCVKFEHSHIKMTDKKKYTSKTNKDIDGNSLKMDERTTVISMMSDDITKIVKGQSCIQDLLKTMHALQNENERC